MFVWLRSRLSVCVLSIFYFPEYFFFILNICVCRQSLWRCFVADSIAFVVVSLICPSTAEPALVISTRALLINTLRGGSALPSLPIFNSPASDAGTNCTRGTHTQMHRCAQFCFPQSKMPPHFPGYMCVCVVCFPFVFLFSPFPKWSTFGGG